MNSKHTETLPAHLISLDSLIQEDGILQQASIISPNSNHSIVGIDDCTPSFYPEYDSPEWKFRDEEKTIWSVDLLAEAPQYYAFGDPFLSNITEGVTEEDVLGWYDANIAPTIEQSLNYRSDEDDEDSWLEMAEFIDTSFLNGDVPEDSSIRNATFGPSGRSSPSISTESEVIYKHATESINPDLSVLSDSTFSTSPPFPEIEGPDTPNCISSESQPSEIDSLQTIPTDTKGIEVIDLTADDLPASPEPPNVQPKDDPSNGRVVTPRLIFVDLTQDEDDDNDDYDDNDEEEHGEEGEERKEAWFDGNCDSIDYNYRSLYENQTRSMTPVIGSSHSRKPSCFSVTEILHNGKPYRWNHRCKWYKNGNSYARPNHQDTAIVIRDGGGDIPINLTYKGFGIWEGSNYRVGAVISDSVAEDMVFRRHSLQLTRKRGCMYSEDLSPRKRKRNSKPRSS